jgi:hypothetical protein
MAMLILVSSSGSPGVTTLAVGLALTWPRSVILADCDPGAHQSVLAGFLAGRSAHGKGLLRIAEAHRDRRPLREVLLDQCEPLVDDPAYRRLFLPGFTKPGSAGHFGGVWSDLAEAFERLSDAGYDVIVDGGRVGGSGIPAPLVEHAAQTCLVLRSHLRSVMSARVHLPSLRDHVQLDDASSALGLVLVGESDPYSRAEISKALGVPALGVLAEDQRAAAHLSDGRPRPRKFDHSPLVTSLHDLSGLLASRLERSAELVRS